MKQIVYIFFLSFLLLVSCEKEEVAVKSDTGYLRLAVSTISSTTTKTGVPENYNPKQLYVEILDAAGKVVESTDDFSTDWTGKQFELKAGTYTIKASSNGFDGSVADFDIPYYAGETTVTVVKDKEVTASVVCKLANVKVTVNFDSSFSKAFKSAEASVSSFLEGVSPLSFTMGVEKGAAYFPEGNLIATIRVVNFDGGAFVQRDTIKNVKANDHYILNYQVKLEGEGDIKIEVDETERVYSITFGVNPNPTTTLEVDYPNAWSTFAYATGQIASKEDDDQIFDSSLMYFEYSKKNEEEWQRVAATDNGNDTYKATLSKLTPGTTYEYRLVYETTNGSEYYESATKTFVTEAGEPLYNGGFEYWYSSGKCDYPNEENPKDPRYEHFWDTSNPGAATYVGSVTTQEKSVVHGGSSSAKLASTWAIAKFAAASLYSGSFATLVGTSGAKLDWGRSFNSRPTSLHGYFQYAPGKINRGADRVPSDKLPEGVSEIKKNETSDWCSVYIVLTTKVFHVDNTDMDNFPVFKNMGLSDGVVAYAELPISECVNTGGQWKEFNLELEYRDLVTKPTHIIVVCSSSKYGDYFTGSDDSVLYLDDFELIYGDNPKTVE